MAPLIDSIRDVMNSGRAGNPTCLVCGRRVTRDDKVVRLRGGTVVHRVCATYEMRRRPTAGR